MPRRDPTDASVDAHRHVEVDIEPVSDGAIPQVLTDFVPSPNQLAIEQYEIENGAFDRRGLLLDAMRVLAPWSGRTLLDLGCGTGFWLPKYRDAARLIGVEPDERLLAVARDREADAEVLVGSAEHIPLPDASVDVVHARFAYFFPPGVDAGLAEVMRVLRPGGTLVVVDNDLRHGEFGELLVGSSWAEPQGRASSTDAWWLERDARRVEVMSDWSFDSREDLEIVMRLELPAAIADHWLREHPDREHITYGYVLFAVAKPDSPEDVAWSSSSGRVPFTGQERRVTGG